MARGELPSSAIQEYMRQAHEYFHNKQTSRKTTSRQPSRPKSTPRPSTQSSVSDFLSRYKKEGANVLKDNTGKYVVAQKVESRKPVYKAPPSRTYYQSKKQQPVIPHQQGWTGGPMQAMYNTPKPKPKVLPPPLQRIVNVREYLSEQAKAKQPVSPKKIKELMTSRNLNTVAVRQSYMGTPSPPKIPPKVSTEEFLRKAKEIADITGNKALSSTIKRAMKKAGISEKKPINVSTPTVAYKQSVIPKRKTSNADRIAEEYYRGVQQGKWKTPYEYAKYLYNKRQFIKTDTPVLGFVAGMLRGDDVHIREIEKGVVKTLEQADVDTLKRLGIIKDNTYYKPVVMSKEQGIQEEFFNRGKEVLENLDRLYPDRDENGNILLYTWYDKNGNPIKGLTGKQMRERVRQEIENERQVLLREGINAQREWHPKTKVIKYNPRIYHVDPDTGEIIPGPERWKDEKGNIIPVSKLPTVTYYHKFPYAGAETYYTYKKLLTEGDVGKRFGTAVASSLTGTDPLGLRSLANIAMGKPEEATDVKIQALHSIVSVGKRYNPVTGRWENKDIGTTLKNFAGYWWEMPTTQIGLALAAGTGAGIAGQPGMSYIQGTTRWAGTMMPKVAQAGMLAGGATLSAPMAWDIYGSAVYEKDIAKAIGKAGQLGASIGAGYAGYKLGASYRPEPGGIAHGLVRGKFGYAEGEGPLTFGERAYYRGMLHDTKREMKLIEKGLAKGLSEQQIRQSLDGKIFRGIRKISLRTKNIPERASLMTTYDEAGNVIYRSPQEALKYGAMRSKYINFIKGKGGAGFLRQVYESPVDELVSGKVIDYQKIRNWNKVREQIKQIASKTAQYEKGVQVAGGAATKYKVSTGDLDLHMTAKQAAKLLNMLNKAGGRVSLDDITKLGIDVQRLPKVGEVVGRSGITAKPGFRTESGEWILDPREQFGRLAENVASTPFERVKDISEAGRLAGDIVGRSSPQYQEFLKYTKFFEKSPYRIDPLTSKYMFKPSFTEKLWRTKVKLWQKVTPKSIQSRQYRALLSRGQLEPSPSTYMGTTPSGTQIYWGGFTSGAYPGRAGYQIAERPSLPSAVQSPSGLVAYTRLASPSRSLLSSSKFAISSPSPGYGGSPESSYYRSSPSKPSLSPSSTPSQSSQQSSRPSSRSRSSSKSSSRPSPSYSRPSSSRSSPYSSPYSPYYSSRPSSSPSTPSPYSSSPSSSSSSSSSSTPPSSSSSSSSSASSSSSSSSYGYAPGKFFQGFPGRMSIPLGGFRFRPYRKKGYFERQYDIPDIWKASSLAWGGKKVSIKPKFFKLKEKKKLVEY